MSQGDVELQLGQYVATALKAAFGVQITPVAALIRPSNRPGVDYQCNVALSLGKKLERDQRELAEGIVTHLDAANMVQQAEVAGPGFINLVLKQEWLEHEVVALLDDERLGVPVIELPRRLALDYSGPNMAKEMHIGHLRSTIIGDALSRMLSFAGHEVVPHNHIGDWGVTFGMLLEHLVDENAHSAADSAEHSISDLGVFYQEARKKFDSDSDFSDRARHRVVLLQSGDEETLALWRQFIAESIKHFEEVYALLGVKLTSADIYGESFYNPYLDTVIEELEAKGLAQVSNGALCVFPPGFYNRDGDPLPLIVRNSAGGYNYATTDLATARYWINERGMDDLLYLVDHRQSDHFKMVFAVSRMAGYLHENNNAIHIPFGTILGENGKIIKTRAGGSLKLIELLTEACDRAAEVVAERSELDSETQKNIARIVGIGAVKYADLCNDRERDYVFSWKKMLAKDGNTSVYLQYANARIKSILRKAGHLPQSGTPVVLTESAERALALKLLQLPTAFNAALEGYAPHKLCGYLYELATAFSSFYENCPVLATSTPDNIRESRLVLASVTSSALMLGLSLLGIEAPEQL